MIKSGNVAVYRRVAGQLLAGMNTDDARRKAEEYGLTWIDHGDNAAPGLR